MNNYAIFCDDVRQEVNGKFLLVGCYSRVALVTSFPTKMPLTALVAFRCDVEKFDFHASWSLSTGAQLGGVEIEVEGELRPDDFAHIPLPRIMLNLSSPDEVILKGWKNGEEPQELGRLRVELVAGS